MVNEQVQYISISKLIISKYNVRKESSDLTELTNSIRSIGILQPLIVRSTPKGAYEIIAGSRRFAAAKEANLRELPVIVKDITDEDAIIESLSENLQRGDLTLDEIAERVFTGAYDQQDNGTYLPVLTTGGSSSYDAHTDVWNPNAQPPW